MTKGMRESDHTQTSRGIQPQHSLSDTSEPDLAQSTVDKITEEHKNATIPQALEMYIKMANLIGSGRGVQTRNMIAERANRPEQPNHDNQNEAVEEQLPIQDILQQDRVPLGLPEPLVPQVLNQEPIPQPDQPEQLHDTPLIDPPDPITPENLNNQEAITQAEPHPPQTEPQPVNTPAGPSPVQEANNIPHYAPEAEELPQTIEEAGDTPDSEQEDDTPNSEIDDNNSTMENSPPNEPASSPFGPGTLATQSDPGPSKGPNQRGISETSPSSPRWEIDPTELYLSDSESSRFLATDSENENSPGNDNIPTTSKVSHGGYPHPPRPQGAYPHPSRVRAWSSDTPTHNTVRIPRPGQKRAGRPGTPSSNSPPRGASAPNLPEDRAQTPPRDTSEPTTSTLRQMKKLASHNKPGLTEGSEGKRRH